MSTLKGTTMHPRCRHIGACWDLLECWFQLFSTSHEYIVIKIINYNNVPTFPLESMAATCLLPAVTNTTAEEYTAKLGTTRGMHDHSLCLLLGGGGGNTHEHNE